MSRPLIAITGASSGIGSEIAKLFSRSGYPLLLLARRLAPMQKLELPNTLCLSVDVTDASALRDALHTGEEMYGPVDGMINCAGLMLLGDVADQDAREWRRMYDVNVLGVLYGMQAVLPAMKVRKRGTIINVSSTAGFRSYPNHAAYCGTKHALNGITETAREELAATGVRVITISPGATETELLSHSSSDAIKRDYEDWKESIGGVMQPGTVAEAVLFAYQMPQEVCVRDLVLAPTGQSVQSQTWVTPDSPT